jgi:hypothetical protein
LIHHELEAAEGDRSFFEDASRTALFDSHIREVRRQGRDAHEWEYIDVFVPWGFRLADIAIAVTSSIRRKASPRSRDGSSELGIPGAEPTDACSTVTFSSEAGQFQIRFVELI